MDNTNVLNKRWRSSKEQLAVLEYFYKAGLVRPNRDQIEAIATLLRSYGEVETISVYFWFQNQRYKQKHDQQMVAKFLAPLPPIAEGSIESVESDPAVATLDLFPIPPVHTIKEVIRPVSKPAAEPSLELTLRTPRHGKQSL